MTGPGLSTRTATAMHDDDGKEDDQRHQCDDDVRRPEQKLLHPADISADRCLRFEARSFRPVQSDEPPPCRASVSETQVRDAAQLFHSFVRAHGVLVLREDVILPVSSICRAIPDEIESSDFPVHYLDYLSPCIRGRVIAPAPHFRAY